MCACIEVWGTLLRKPSDREAAVGVLQSEAEVGSGLSTELQVTPGWPGTLT